MLLRLIVVFLLLWLLQPAQAHMPVTAATDDLAFLQPWFTLEEEDRETLAQRGVVVRRLPASRQQISVIATCAVAISSEAFVAAARSIGHMNRKNMVTGRFSEPPALADLKSLTLEQGDIDRLRACQPGDCALNLAEEEMSDLQRALSETPGASGDVQNAFRRVVLDRVRRYRSGGLAALPAYHDRSEPVRPAAVFSEILQQTPFLNEHVPAVLTYLERYPSAPAVGATSFLTWSKVFMNNKPVVMVGHLTTFRPDPGAGIPAVLLTAKQVYASRYMNGELQMWMFFARGNGAPNYLALVHRSHLDELGGSWNGLKRAVFEGRIKEEAATRLAKLRDQLENGH